MRASVESAVQNQPVDPGFEPGSFDESTEVRSGIISAWPPSYGTDTVWSAKTPIRSA